MTEIRILLADKGAIFRLGVVKLLEDKPKYKLVATCTSGLETIEKAVALKPDVILLDDDITGCDSMETAQRIRDLGVATRIIILAHGLGSHSALAIFHIAGVRAYINKATDVERILSTIDNVAMGHVVISPELAARLIDELAALKEGAKAEQPTYDYVLSRREEEVIGLVAQGLTNKEVADKLFITENTVKSHLSRILEKMQVRNRHKAIIIAREMGLIHTPEALRETY